MRRILGVLVALAAVGAAAASVQGVDLARELRARTLAENEGVAALVRAEEALSAYLGSLEPQASQAAATGSLRVALAQALDETRARQAAVPPVPEQPDRPSRRARSGQGAARPKQAEPRPETAPAPIDAGAAQTAPTLDKAALARLRERLGGDLVWQESIQPFSHVALLVGETLAMLREPLDKPRLEALSLARTVRTKGLGSGLALAGHRPHAAAADRFLVQEQPVVLLVARPLDDEAVSGMAAGLGASIVLSTGGEAVAAAGPDAAVLRLLARRDPGANPIVEIAHRSSGTWVSSHKQLANSLSLWVRKGVNEAPAESKTATLTKAAIWAGAGLLALLSIGLGFRRSGLPAPSEGPKDSNGHAESAEESAPATAGSPHIAPTPALAPSKKKPPPSGLAD